MSSVTASNSILTNSINAITPTTGDINIGGSQTDGILNLGTGTGRTATGVINIGNSTGIAPIRIESGSNKNTDVDPAISIGTSVVTNGRTIKIGNTEIGANVNSINIGNIRFRNNKIDGVDPTGGSMLIGAAQTNGILAIGGGDGVVRSGAVTICSGPSCSSNIDIFTNTTNTGTFNLGTATTTVNTTKANILTGNTTGLLTLGNSNNQMDVNSSNINILNAPSAAGTIRIANGSNNATAITIGNNTSTSLTLKATTMNLQNDNSTGGTLNIKSGASSTGDVNIKSNNSNTGTVNIANGSGTGQTTSVNIGSGSTTGAVTIGNPANTTSILSGTTNINTGTGVLGTPLAGTVNIATGTGATFVSTAVNIGTGNTTGTVTIGNTDNTVQINGGLTMGTGKKITLQPNTGYVAPTAGQLGFITAGTAVPTGAQSSNFTASTITIPTSGVYMISFWTEAGYSVIPTAISVVVSWTVGISGTDFLNGNAFGFTAISTLRCDGSFPMNINATGNIVFTINLTGAITILKGFFVATRIG